MPALNQLAPEASLVLSERIIRPMNQPEPLLLVAVSNTHRKNEKVALVQLQKKSVGAYMAFLPKRDYELFVFADMDGNGDFAWNEMISGTKVTIGPGIPKAALSRKVHRTPWISLIRGKIDFNLGETVRPTGSVYLIGICILE